VCRKIFAWLLSSTGSPRESGALACPQAVARSDRRPRWSGAVTRRPRTRSRESSSPSANAGWSPRLARGSPPRGPGRQPAGRPVAPAISDTPPPNAPWPCQSHQEVEPTRAQGYAGRQLRAVARSGGVANATFASENLCECHEASVDAFPKKYGAQMEMCKSEVLQTTPPARGNPPARPPPPCTRARVRRLSALRSAARRRGPSCTWRSSVPAARPGSAAAP